MRDLGKLIVAKGFKKLPKVQSGHADPLPLKWSMFYLRSFVRWCYNSAQSFKGSEVQARDRPWRLALPDPWWGDFSRRRPTCHVHQHRSVSQLLVHLICRTKFSVSRHFLNSAESVNCCFLVSDVWHQEITFSTNLLWQLAKHMMIGIEHWPGGDL